ncbi:hypothetical protein LNTAR_10196 [Lentisphaera araneosa HTCC2155]|uniref:Uncharacterized protein n=1 Tax=Lentisphaera araneosa HTCC2155 TaxID=313628 RepID=A6DIJ2_9BACT|nr:hypothetical protein [Lentisphaera araneosa]EDM28278.1 hypothetical protein LNTAR_10196 [Lentisphaera araneosa HTCC2155]
MKKRVTISSDKYIHRQIKIIAAEQEISIQDATDAVLILGVDGFRAKYQTRKNLIDQRQLSDLPIIEEITLRSMN